MNVERTYAIREKDAGKFAVILNGCEMNWLTFSTRASAHEFILHHIEGCISLSSYAVWLDERDLIGRPDPEFQDDFALQEDF
jgi:hypothetical protein